MIDSFLHGPLPSTATPSPTAASPFGPRHEVASKPIRAASLSSIRHPNRELDDRLRSSHPATRTCTPPTYQNRELDDRLRSSHPATRRCAPPTNPNRGWRDCTDRRLTARSSSSRFGLLGGGWIRSSKSSPFRYDRPVSACHPGFPLINNRFHGAVAQLGERSVRNAKVRGSRPLSSTDQTVLNFSVPQRSLCAR